MLLRRLWGWMLVGIWCFSSEVYADPLDVRSTFEPMERRLYSAYGWDSGRRVAKPVAPPSVGTRRSFWAYDWTPSGGHFYEVEATCQGVGAHAYIFVEDAQWNRRVHPRDVEGLIEVFDRATPGHPDQGIYARTTGAFGEPPDVDGDPTIYILLLDIRDAAKEQKGYVAGYFSGVNEYSDREAQRFGYRSNETEMFYMDVDPGDVSSDYARRTLAHEFQHMIHFNQDSDEESWINEGCSTFSEWVSGYGMRPPARFKDDPNNSLTDWGGSLVDYEQTGMFVDYLYEHWGGMETIRALVANAWNGTIGVTKTLEERGTKVGFYEVFRDWVIANYLDDEAVGDGRYAYTAYDLSGRYKFGATRTYRSYPVDMMQEKVRYSATQYLRFMRTADQREKALWITFDGTTRNDFTVQVIALREGEGARVEVMSLDALNDGSWSVEHADELASLTEVILVPTIRRMVGFGALYRYAATEKSGPRGIVRVTPLPGSSDVPLDATLSVVFSAAYNPSTVRMDLGRYPGGAWKQSADGRELTVALAGRLEPNTRYTLSVKAGVKDLDGRTLTTDDYVWTFTTGERVTEEETYLAYDEGRYDYHLYWEKEGESSGVRFTPPYVPAQLLSVCFYLTDLSRGRRFLVRIAEDDGTGWPGKEVTDSLDVEADATGWLTVDLRERDVRVHGDFHVMFETVTVRSSDGTKSLCQPRFGAEDFPPTSGRSWDRYFRGDPPVLKYEKIDSLDYGIRAVVAPVRPGTAVEEETTRTPGAFALRQNFPNPFNGETTIAYVLPRTTDPSRMTFIELMIYDLSGRRVRQLERGRRMPGAYTVRWDGRDEAGRETGSGIYLYRLKTLQGTQVRKMVRVR